MPAPNPARLRGEPSEAAKFDPDWVRQFVKELAQYRERQGLTQAEVAKQMGTSQPYVARLESAAIDPRLSTVLRYAAVVAGGIAVAALLKELLRAAGPGAISGR